MSFRVGSGKCLSYQLSVFLLRSNFERFLAGKWQGMDSLGFEAKYGSLRVGRNAPLRIHSHLISSTEPSLVESRRRLYVPQYLTQCNHKCWMRSFYISDISTRRDEQVNGRPFLASKPQCSWEAFFVCVSARLHVRAWVCLCSPWCRPYRLSTHLYRALKAPP